MCTHTSVHILEESFAVPNDSFSRWLSLLINPPPRHAQGTEPGLRPLVLRSFIPLLSAYSARYRMPPHDTDVSRQAFGAVVNIAGTSFEDCRRIGLADEGTSTVHHDLLSHMSGSWSKKCTSFGMPVTSGCVKRFLLKLVVPPFCSAHRGATSVSTQGRRAAGNKRERGAFVSASRRRQLRCVYPKTNEAASAPARMLLRENKVLWYTPSYMG